MSLDLDKILDSEPEEIKAERNLFSKLYIVKGALKKAQLYASFAKDYSNNTIECYGFSLGSLNKQNRVIEDIYFAPEQTNTSAHTRISAETVIQAGKEIREKKKRVLGWWHSHANFDPFHSGTDAENMKTVIDQVAPTNYINVYEDITFLKDEIKKTFNGDSSILVCDRNNSSKRLEMIFASLDKNPLIGMPMEKIIVRIPNKISYAYSLVVNANGEQPYAEIATIKFCSSCHSDEYESRKVPIRVLDVDTDIELDEKILREEVRSKIKINKPRYRIVHGNYKKHGKIFCPDYLNPGIPGGELATEEDSNIEDAAHSKDESQITAPVEPTVIPRYKIFKKLFFGGEGDGRSNK